MTRSPLFYPLNRGMDAEAGGIADLQTDVMRFIAILALCLVAIFALVQSLPLLPTIPQAQAPQAATQSPSKPKAHEPTLAETDMHKPMVESESPPVPVAEKPLVITRPAPQRTPAKRTPQRIIERTIAPVSVPATEPVLAGAPQPIDTATEEDQHTVVQPVTTQSEGFTLRFETDLALTRLVARNEVGLYAITPEKSLRMNVNRGSPSFWPASLPKEFHEMDTGTVPEEVLSALKRAGTSYTADVKWGVTLPRDMRGELDKYLSEHSGGSLIISGDGNLRMEP